MAGPVVVISIWPSDQCLPFFVIKPQQDIDDPFYVVDLGRVIELHQNWVAALPTVTPFYAVKCNNDLALLKTLAALGTGFDCASKVCLSSKC